MKIYVTINVVILIYHETSVVFVNIHMVKFEKF